MLWLECSATDGYGVLLPRNGSWPALDGLFLRSSSDRQPYSPHRWIDPVEFLERLRNHALCIRRRTQLLRLRLRRELLRPSSTSSHEAATSTSAKSASAGAASPLQARPPHRSGWRRNSCKHVLGNGKETLMTTGVSASFHWKQRVGLKNGRIQGRLFNEKCPA